MSNRLNIVQIQSALLLPVTAQFIIDKLGIKPSETEKRAVYWKPEDFTHICQGLIQHITAARNADFSRISAERPKKTDATPAAAPSGDDPFGLGGGTNSASSDDPFGMAEETASEFF